MLVTAFSRITRLAAALLAAALLSGAAAPLHAAERIVAAGGVITEILYALGREDHIVGVDATSLHPPAALGSKPNVGYVRALSAEGVLSLRPSLVIAITSAGPPDSLRLLREAGVRIEVTPEDWTPEGVVARIRQVGRLAGAEAAADRLGAAVAARFSELAAARAQIARPQRVLFVLTLQNGRPMVGGRNSAADAIIRLAGGINAADAVEGYKPMTDEAVIGAAPDVVLTMARGSHALTADDIFALPAFRLTPAAARRRLVTMDGLLLLGFGPRTPEAGFELMSAVHGPLATGAIR